MCVSMNLPFLLIIFKKYTYWSSQGTCSTFKIILFFFLLLLGVLYFCLFLPGFCICELLEDCVLMSSTKIMFKIITSGWNLDPNLISVALQTCLHVNIMSFSMYVTENKNTKAVLPNHEKLRKHQYHLCWLSYKELLVLYTFPPVSFSTLLWLTVIFPK